MVNITCLCLVLSGTICLIQGQTFKISTKFMKGKLIFTWSNISTRSNDIVITKDSQSSEWIRVSDDQYTVENVIQYKSLNIKVREYNSQGYADYTKTYNINTVESKEGESKNISWTAKYFPLSGHYFIFYAYNGSVSTIIRIANTDPPPTEKYVYHTRPFNSTNIVFEVRNITVEDAGYYVGSPTGTDAWSGERGVVLIVSGKPLKPIITGDLDVKVRTNAYLKCESRSTSAPDYYSEFPPLSYSWFVNNTRLDGVDSETFKFIVSKDTKYNRYSCQAKETLESERSSEIRINPLYGPENVIITPQPPHNRLVIHEGDVFGPYDCSADCNPPCTLQWKYKNPSEDFSEATSISYSSVTLPKQTANRTAMASIRCVVIGPEGRNISNIKLTIQYLSDPKVYIDGKNQNSLTVNEGIPLFLSCFVEGNPTPEVTLRKLSGDQTLGKKVDKWLNYTSIREAQCLDTSTYICEGNSSEFGSRDRSFDINVLCDPRLDESTSFKTNYGSMSGPDVKVFVNVPVVANPLTSHSGFAWSGTTSSSISIKVSQRDNFTYKHWINSTIPMLDQRNFGNYSLKYNGKVIVDITINAEDKPKPPLNFTGYSYAIGYVNLTWLSNFNGGPEQFFILSQKKGSSWIEVTNLTDPGEGNLGYYDPGLLNTGQEYWYRLESCNRINCSSRPAEVKVLVRALSSSSSQSSVATIAIAASTAIFILVVVVAIIVALFLLRKKSVQQRKNSDKRSSKAPEQDNTQPDVVVYAAVDKSLLVKNRQQADVIKSDVIKEKNDEHETMYSNMEEAELLSKTDGKKENKKKKKKGEKKEEVEEEKGATYGNVESRTMNQDGLIYIDVDFANKNVALDKRGKQVIHGEDERTEYTFVDFSKKAPPIQETEDEGK